MDRLLAAPLDPTGYGWVGQVLALLGILAGLVVAVRAWIRHRDR